MTDAEGAEGMWAAGACLAAGRGSASHHRTVAAHAAMCSSVCHGTHLLPQDGQDGQQGAQVPLSLPRGAPPAVSSCASACLPVPPQGSLALAFRLAQLQACLHAQPQCQPLASPLQMLMSNTNGGMVFVRAELDKALFDRLSMNPSFM